MKRIIILFAVQIFVAVSIYAADQNVLLKGSIKDINGNPVGTKIKVIGEDGNSSIGKSNTIDGKFDQVLKSDKKYSIVIEGYIVEPFSDAEFSALNVDKYTEMYKNFTVRKIDKGMLVGEFNGFDANEATFKTSEKLHLEFLKEFLKTNIGANVEITISANDSKFQAKKGKQEVIEKGKKKVKTINLTNQDQLRILCADRIASIKALFKSMSIPDRNIIFVENAAGSIINDKSKKTKNKEIENELPDIKIIVNKLIKF
jgi:hypothetical protein